MTIQDGSITSEKLNKKNLSWLPWTLAGVLAVLALIFGVTSSNLSTTNGELEAEVRVQTERVEDLNNNLSEAVEAREAAIAEKDGLAESSKACMTHSDNSERYMSVLEETVVLSLTLTENLMNLDEASAVATVEALDAITPELEEAQTDYRTSSLQCDSGGTV